MPSKAGALDLLKLPGVFIIVSKANMPPAGGSQCSVVNHIGLAVKDYADVKAKAAAAGLMWRDLTPNVQAFVTFPEMEIQRSQRYTARTRRHDSGW